MQGWYGGITTTCLTPIQRVLPDVTAIAIAYVNSGFVIAADGFARWSNDETADDDTHKAETDNEQKIFAANFKGQKVAWAITGLAFNRDRTFNFAREVDSAIEAAFATRFATVDRSLDITAASVNRSLAKAKADGQLPKFPESDLVVPGTIATVFAAGYFRKGKPPSLAMLTFHHRDQALLDPQISVQTPPSALIRAGSSKIADLLDRFDHRFTEFSLPLKLESSLQDAVRWAKGYVEACSTATAREIDLEACKGIGGHVHIAAITAKEGFYWIRPPARRK